MLVLNRKVGEKIFIGPDIVITLVRSTGKQARIGIDAPEHLRISRDDTKHDPHQQGAIVK